MRIVTWQFSSARPLTCIIVIEVCSEQLMSVHQSQEWYWCWIKMLSKTIKLIKDSILSADVKKLHLQKLSKH